MTKKLKFIETDDDLPDATSIVIIGGGIIGVSTALALAERNIPVVLLEKGHIAGEQSSRNLGWVRKTSRHLHDLPMAQAADRLWKNMAERVGQDVGYRQTGIMFLADSSGLLNWHESWLNSVSCSDIDAQLITQKQIEKLVPGGQRTWAGALYTPSDGRAEPAKATTAMAKAAMAKGAKIIQHCAVRSLFTTGGKISGVMTEKGEIRCEQVLLAGGAWSRRFLKNSVGISLPTLPVICSVLRTKPMNGPCDIAVGGSDFSFRKHDDGGYIITQRGKVDAPITLDHLQVGWSHRKQFKEGKKFLNVSLNRYFFQDLAIARSWSPTEQSPFEHFRTINPAPNLQLNQDALNNLSAAWPMFKDAQIEEAWAGLIDVTPDSIPVIDQLDAIPGLVLATGFSGHGFGTGPAAGQLAADLLSNHTPIIDPTPYQFNRFWVN